MNMHVLFSRQSQAIRTNQQGMVSIMVTMILMIVMSLIVLGFAQNSRRNQRETLDRQLSTQAFYAAESGVNDARNVITGLSGVPPAKTSCSDAGPGNQYKNLTDSTKTTLNTAANVAYTCVLINPIPKTLQFPGVSTTSTVTPLFSGDGSNFSNITFTWTSRASSTPANGCAIQYIIGSTLFTPTGAPWTCGYGVMRLDLVPVDGNLTAAGLQSSARTIWTVPVKASGTNTYNFGSDTNKVIGVRCTNSNCTLNVIGLSSSKYYVRMQSIYQPATMNITSPLGLAGSQIIIDSTGRAQDVLRRIQVRMSVDAGGSKNQLPDNALQSTDSICKRFATMNGYFDNNVGVAGSNALCQ